MKKNALKLALAAVALVALGWLIGIATSGGNRGAGAPETPAAAAEDALWTCSMHHQIKRDKPGKCPICAMDLIPVSQLKGKDDAGPRELAMTEEGRKLAGIRTVPVERRLVEAEIRLVGKIDYDETRKKTLAAWFPGRIDRLYVDYTGVEVKAGDHLAHVYSPELLTAQKELLSAIKFGSEVETIRDKLRLWGLSAEKIRAIEERGETSDRMDIDSPLGGVVIQKYVKEGDYRKTGEPLFEIADLSRVWVQLEAYESDLPWLRYGQTVTFEGEALPGKTFEGIVAFISPVLDPATRTVKVRVNAENPGYQLKPGLFVRAVVRSTIADLGKVVAPELKGKWISPMHPEIIRDEPGNCPICGMKLVKAEDLGYTVVNEAAEQLPLVIPASSALQTGKRAVVYVELPDRPQPTFEGREVVLGARAGDFYIVEEGLAEGERIVTEGNFKIDSALQIVAKPSMMAPEGGGGGGGHQHGVSGAGAARGAGRGAREMKRYEVDATFRDQLGAVLHDYFAAQEALAADDLEGAETAAAEFGETLAKIDMALLSGDAHMAWMGLLPPLREAAEALATAGAIESARTEFRKLSDALTHSVTMFGATGHEALYQVHCPMAFENEGADWLQKSEEVRNPYFGARMLKCGEVKAVWGGGQGAKGEGEEKGK